MNRAERDILELIRRGENLTVEFKSDARRLDDDGLSISNPGGFVIDTHGSVKRADVIEFCPISPDQAYKLLAKLKKKDLIKQAGERVGAIYERAR